MPERSGVPDPAQLLTQLIRQDRGRLLAALSRYLRDVDLAEESLADACESALVHWGRSGVPTRPDAWLLTVAKRKALDRLRRVQRFSNNAGAVARLLHDEAQSREVEDIPDDRLRLIFTCCHPALERKSSVALTLRLLGGLTTEQIARAFLDAPATMGQRISRAKAKISAAGIPFVIPGPDAWSERLAHVLNVIYLIYTVGYVPPDGDVAAADLCLEALYLARLVDELCPEQPEVEGLLALLTLVQARRPAWLAAEILDAQDPAEWDAALLEQGLAILNRAVARRSVGPYQLQAAIQALHVEGGQSGTTDWHQIALLYTRLLAFTDTPVVRLNLAVASAELRRLDAALGQLRALQHDLDGYQPFHAAYAHVLALNCDPQAADAYDRAIALSMRAADARYLKRCRDRLLKDQ